MNCIIGAKGKGKSALLESIRFALNLNIPEIQSSMRERQKFRNRNDALLDNILGPKGTVECIVESQTGIKYLFRRSRADNTPTITSETDGIERPYYDLSETFNCRFYGWEELTSCSEELNLLTDIFDAHLGSITTDDGTFSLSEILRNLKDNERQVNAALSNIQIKHAELQEYIAIESTINSLAANLEDESKGQDKLKTCIEHQQACTSEESLLGTIEEYLKLKPSIILHPPKDISEHIPITEPLELLSNEKKSSGPVNTSGRTILSKKTLSKRKELLDCFGNICNLYASLQQMIGSTWSDKSSELMRALKASITQYSDSLDEESKKLRRNAGISSQSEASKKLRAINQLQKSISENKKSIKGKTEKTLRNRYRKQVYKYVDLLRKRRRLYKSITDGRTWIANELSQQYESILKANFRSRCQLDEYKNRLKIFFSNSGLQYNVLIDTIVAKRIMPETFCILLLNWKEKSIMKALEITQQQAAKIYKQTYDDLVSKLKPFHSVSVPDVPEVKMLINPLAETDDKKYRLVSKLSAGERSTVILPLVTHGTPNPLVIDQPEDDLDNTYIHDSFVHSLLRLSKGLRQFIFATHNANIPVLGDSENVIVMDASYDKGYIKSQGCTDTVAGTIMDILEGGKQAFKDRYKKYGIAIDKPNNT